MFNRIASFLSVLFLSFFIINSSFALSFTVNTVTDAVDSNIGNGICATAGGDCSLRAAIQEANAQAGSHSITLPAGLFKLTVGGSGEDMAATGDLDITKNLTITGAGSTKTVIDGQFSDRILDVLGNTTLTVSNVRLQNGFVSGLAGGAISSSGNQLVTLSDVDFFSNSSEEGGAFAGAGPLTVNRAIFRDNRAESSDGGAIYVTANGAVQVTASNFENNFAEDSAGALVSNAQSTVINNSTFEGNLARTSSGGCAILVGAGASGVEIRDSEFINCQSTASGGSFIAQGVKVGLYDSNFVNNIADTGGGFAILASEEIVINGILSQHNYAASNGGGGFLQLVGPNSTMNISESQFVANFSLQGGGLTAQANTADVTIDKLTVKDNLAEAIGGIGLLGFADLKATNMNIENNGSLDGPIGGAYIIAGGPAEIAISDSRFAMNSSNNGFGGGLVTTSSSKITISRNSFYYNSASGAGGFAGGLYIGSGDESVIVNNTFSGNDAGASGGGIAVADGDASILNCTFAYNTASQDGAALANIAAGSVVTSNSIFSYSIGDNCFGAIASAGHNIDDNGSCGFAGVADTTVDPLLGALADNGGFAMTHMPAINSPAVDSVNGLCPADDQRGVLRPVDGNNDGSAICDRGSVELNDLCPSDANKQLPGTCGCGLADTDDNGNSVIDCLGNDDLEKQLKKLNKKVNRIKPASTNKQKKSVRNLAKKITNYLNVWSSSVTLGNGKDAAKLFKGIRRQANKLSKASSSEVDELVSKTKKKIKKLRKQL